MTVDLCRMLTFCVEDHILVQVAGAGWDVGWASQPAFDADAETEDHFVIGTREAVIVHDFNKGSRVPPSPILAAHNVRSAVEVLICGKEGPVRTVGCLCPSPGCFDTDSANFVRSVANTLAAAIDRGRGDEQLTRLAQFDSLTGLPNRSLYLDRLSQTLVESKRDKRPVAVLFVDIDLFKYVNDTLGHAVGDQLLVQIADRLRARYGLAILWAAWVAMSLRSRWPILVTTKMPGQWLSVLLSRWVRVTKSASTSYTFQPASA